MPGSTPATSQLDWLSSTTAMIVLSWSRATRDLLKSFGWGIRALHQLATATMVPFPRRLPHTISLLEGDGFELVWGFSCQVVVFGFCRFFVRSWKAVLRPVACDQVRGARGRGQGTETVAKLGGLPPSVACVSQRLDARARGAMMTCDRGFLHSFSVWT